MLCRSSVVLSLLTIVLSVLSLLTIVLQNPYIEEEQTTQWPKEKYKRTNNDLQNIHKICIDRKLTNYDEYCLHIYELPMLLSLVGTGCAINHHQADQYYGQLAHCITQSGIKYTSGRKETTLLTLVVRDTVYKDRCRSNYHGIKATVAHQMGSTMFE
jgi:hypothetical protein